MPLRQGRRIPRGRRARPDHALRARPTCWAAGSRRPGRIGIQDLQNRTFGADETALLTGSIVALVSSGDLPLDDLQTNADMMALLRAIQGMGTPSSFPQVDPSRVLYRGISYGAHHSIGFLAFSPEVLAAAAHVGSGRLYYTILQQPHTREAITQLPAALPGVRPREVAVGIAVPACVDEGIEVATCEGDRICHLEGIYPDEVVKRITRWAKTHGHLVPGVAEYMARAR